MRCMGIQKNEKMQKSRCAGSDMSEMMQACCGAGEELFDFKDLFEEKAKEKASGDDKPAEKE